METFATKALLYDNVDPGWHMGIPTFLTLCGQNKWKKTSYKHQVEYITRGTKSFILSEWKCCRTRFRLVRTFTV